MARRAHLIEQRRNRGSARGYVDPQIRLAGRGEGTKTPMKYYRWLRAFKGVSKRIYGSPLNPMKNTSARGKVGAWLHVKVCVSRESDAMSPHIVGFKFHFVKYFCPASRREWTLQRRRAHPNKALRKLYALRSTIVCMCVCVCVHTRACGCMRVYVYSAGSTSIFADPQTRNVSALIRVYHEISYAKRSIALGYALLILYFVRIPHVVAFVGGFIT